MIPFPAIRRLEAVSFRAFPATSVQYNGTWAVRLTPGHSARRLNSVNPLDPADIGNVEERLGEILAAFDAIDKPVVFRCTPLASPELVNDLLEAGWRQFDETIVMTAPIGEAPSKAHLVEPTNDIASWVDELIVLGEADRKNRESLIAIFERTDAELGLFSVNDETGLPLSAIRCVCAFGMAGLFELVTAEQRRGEGHARKILTAALTWARLKGARSAFLQVVAENRPAVSLYKAVGFTEAYRYTYLEAPETGIETK